MSKSLGNFFTIREVLQRFDSEVLRFFILRAHYRSPLNYSDQALEDAQQALSRLYTALRGTPPLAMVSDWEQPMAARFRAAMEDDFNTPEACAVLFELAGTVNRTRDPMEAAQLKWLGGVLGLLQADPDHFLQRGAGVTEEVSAQIQTLIDARLAARQARNFAEADRIRQLLADQGITLEDSAGGTIWRRG